MRFVPVKTADSKLYWPSLETSELHQTANPQENQIRGLFEFGIVVPRGVQQLSAITLLVEDAATR
jgi:hypothetical protein